MAALLFMLLILLLANTKLKVLLTGLDIMVIINMKFIFLT